jgi:hypothetical protein
MLRNQMAVVVCLALGLPAAASARGRTDANRTLSRIVDNMSIAKPIALRASASIRLVVNADALSRAGGGTLGTVKVSVPARQLLGLPRVPRALEREVADVVVPGMRTASRDVDLGTVAAKITGRGKSARLSFSVPDANLGFWLNNSMGGKSPALILRFRNGMGGGFVLQSQKIVVDWTASDRAVAKEQIERYQGYMKGSLSELAKAKLALEAAAGESAEVRSRRQAYVDTWTQDVARWKDRIGAERSTLARLAKQPHTTAYVLTKDGKFEAQP